MHHDFVEEHLVVNALQRHTATDFALLYQRYGDTLYHVLLRLVGDSELAEDLLQDTFVTIWLNYHHYDPERGRLYTWFLTLTRHIGLDALKAAQRRRVVYTDSYTDFQEAANPVYWQGAIEESLIGSLPPKYQIIIELIYIQGQSFPEAARQLGLPLGTVKTRLRMALAQLRTFYEQDIAHYHR